MLLYQNIQEIDKRIILKFKFPKTTRSVCTKLKKNFNRINFNGTKTKKPLSWLLFLSTQTILKVLTTYLHKWNNSKRIYIIMFHFVNISKYSTITIYYSRALTRNYNLINVGELNLILFPNF